MSKKKEMGFKYSEHPSICEYCRKEFKGAVGRKFCCNKCSGDSRKQRILKVCLCCDKEFEVHNWRVNSLYCSTECKYKYESSPLIDIKCDNCGNDFKRKKWKIELLIEKGFKKQFCSQKCGAESRVSEFNRTNTKEEKRKFSILLRKWSKKIKERDGYVCQLCGEDNIKLLNSHHIKPKSKFPKLALDFNNGITLCLECHLLQHSDDINSYNLILDKIKKYREEVKD